jgi:hypothetical protein
MAKIETARQTWVRRRRRRRRRRRSSSSRSRSRSRSRRRRSRQAGEQGQGVRFGPVREQVVGANEFFNFCRIH